MISAATGEPIEKSMIETPKRSEWAAVIADPCVTVASPAIARKRSR